MASNGIKGVFQIKQFRNTLILEPHPDEKQLKFEDSNKYVLNQNCKTYHDLSDSEIGTLYIQVRLRKAEPREITLMVSNSLLTEDSNYKYFDIVTANRTDVTKHFISYIKNNDFGYKTDIEELEEKLNASANDTVSGYLDEPPVIEPTLAHKVLVKNGTRAFVGRDNDIALYNNADNVYDQDDPTQWVFLSPEINFRMHNTENDYVYKFNGISWSIDNKEITFDSMPVGTTMFSAISTLPSSKWFRLEGQSLMKVDYPDLYNYLLDNGLVSISGEDTNTFTLPDFRGQFLRVWDHGADNDPDRDDRTDRGDGTTGDNILTEQKDALEEHTHYFRRGPTAQDYDYGNNLATSDTFFQNHTNAMGGVSQGRISSETRPINKNIMLMIKALA